MNVEPSRQTKKTKPQAPASKPAKTAATSKPARAATSTAVHRPQRVSPCEDLQALIAKRAYELYCERGYRQGCSLDDWLEAERDILSQIPPV
ncbi:DUF2934 domain-containing protein [Nitrospira sp. NS4]|uniref:DUF2934 domain-containing protein n=1 Tax=Nitrospira sp. NS4 TaxID=3414498 RepID=UPI003C2EC910